MKPHFNGHTRIRKNFGSIREVLSVPNLTEIQKSSYLRFLQIDVPPDQRDTNVGLESIFRSIFPLKGYFERAVSTNEKSVYAVLEYVSYDFEVPKYDVEECKLLNMTFGAPLKVTLCLTVFEVDMENKWKSITDIRKQEVYMGDLPLMTEKGSFVINGVEKVIVSQIHQSPGVYFDHDNGKTLSTGKKIFSATVIPHRGKILGFEFDARDLLFAKIGGEIEFPVTTLMKALGLNSEEILRTFYSISTFKLFKKCKDSWIVRFDAYRYLGAKLSADLLNAIDLKVIAKSGEVFTRQLAHKFKELNVINVVVNKSELIGKYLAENIVDFKSGECLAEAGDEVTEDVLQSAINFNHEEISLLDIDNVNISPIILDTLRAEENLYEEQALINEIFEDDEPPTIKKIAALLDSHFFNEDRYDLSAVGRLKINMRLNIKCEDTVRTLRIEDILTVIKTLVDIRHGKNRIDEKNDLANKRVRSVGEFLENQYRLGFSGMSRSTVKKMQSPEIETMMPQDLINSKPVERAINSFFSSFHLSQYMDQTNPLSEITHVRRVSALGPDGLPEKNTGLAERNIHSSHYGRLCPIETPEGRNFGLISSLATYAKVNKYGFIETPYRKVSEERATNKNIYLSALEESKFNIAQADIELTKDGKIIDEFLTCRNLGKILPIPKEKVNLMDVSPKQVVSVAASLIPFLENNDVKRAVMSSNMMRQAVPLIRSEAPIIGTGMEYVVAWNSGTSILAKRAGIVNKVDATQIVIDVTEGYGSSEAGIEVYQLKKFQGSNQKTCINQKPIVNVGDLVESNDIIADGSCTDRGELALGKNLLVAYMPWNGHNFKDSILLSEKIVREDVLTSIHIEEFEVSVRDTKLGLEEITRNIPEISQEKLKNLDEAGIIYIGVEVKEGDILVGKTTPQRQQQNLFIGKNIPNVKDSSLRVPPGVMGTVIDVKTFNRFGEESDQRSMNVELEKFNQNTYIRLSEFLIGKKAISGPEGFKKNSIITYETLKTFQQNDWWNFKFSSKKIMKKLEMLHKNYDRDAKLIQIRLNEKIENLRLGYELKSGVMKLVKVFIAVKRKLQPGDKIAGRHGNKGVVSKILPIEDMPFLEDGTPIDVVLNPLSIPSRMNIGQILETHLGWACVGMGRQIGELYDKYLESGKTGPLRKKIAEIYNEAECGIELQKIDDNSIVKISNQLKDFVPVASPVFDGANESDITSLLELSKLDKSGQTVLYDGRTGEPFERKITVGYSYLMKLNHMVDDKIHARCIGPYSYVTQQPLGGRSLSGGQSLGEMEIWALAGYGAAYTLQEMLTTKSDDVVSRTKCYEAIIRGDDTFETFIPESFKALVHELRSLGLNFELNDSKYLYRAYTHVNRSEPGSGPTDGASHSETRNSTSDKEIAKLKEKNMQLTAEMENLLRQTEREKHEIIQSTVFSLAKDLLEVSDNLMRALHLTLEKPSENADNNLKALLNFVAMANRSLQLALSNQGVSKIDPLGEKFNSNFHHAIEKITDSDAPDNTVIQVFQVGYMMGERLLRPAYVSVAKTRSDNGEL